MSSYRWSWMISSVSTKGSVGTHTVIASCVSAFQWTDKCCPTKCKHFPSALTSYSVFDDVTWNTDFGNKSRLVEVGRGKGIQCRVCPRCALFVHVFSHDNSKTNKRQITIFSSQVNFRISLSGYSFGVNRSHSIPYKIEVDVTAPADPILSSKGGTVQYSSFGTNLQCGTLLIWVRFERKIPHHFFFFFTRTWRGRGEYRTLITNARQRVYSCYE